jgi:hypothetical protein
MVPLYDFKVEEELRRLCRWALMEEDAKALRVVLAQIRQLVHENPELLRSMPEETWKMMWDLRSRGSAGAHRSLHVPHL